MGLINSQYCGHYVIIGHTLTVDASNLALLNWDSFGLRTTTFKARLPQTTPGLTLLNHYHGTFYMLQQLIVQQPAGWLNRLTRQCTPRLA